MPVVTRHTNANTHPGDIIRKAQRKKRTRQEIEEEKAKSIAAKQEAANKHRAAICSIAALKSSVEHEEEVINAHANRPDLRPCPSNAIQRALLQEVRPHKSTGIMHDRICQSPRPGPDEIVDEEEDVTHPAVLTDDIMMSDQGSDGYASNNEEEILDFPESIEDEGHGMSDMDIDLDGIVSDLATPDVAMPEVVVPDVESYMTTRVTQINERGLLRRQVNKLAGTLPSSKRKASEMMSLSVNPDEDSVSVAPRPLKRSYAFHGGLSKNWRENMTYSPGRRKSSGVSTSLANSTHNGSGISKGTSNPVPGEFDGDEAIKTLKRVRPSKSNAPRARMVELDRQVPRVNFELPTPSPSVAVAAQRTQQMGINIVKVPSSSIQIRDRNTNNRGHTRKLNPTQKDLPLPPGPEYLLRWQKTFLPMLYAWAGSTNDPFCTNGVMSDEVWAIWKQTYPEVVLDEDEEDLVLKVCAGSLFNWRSDVAKAARGAVLTYWKSQLSTINTPLARSRHAKQEGSDLRFVYKDPATTSGIFCSELVSRAYAAHLLKLKKGECGYGDQVGGLALASVAVEYALWLYEDVDSLIHKLEDQDSNSNRRKGPKSNRRKGPNSNHPEGPNSNPPQDSDSNRGRSFREKTWGLKARLLQEPISQLTPELWKMINEGAEAHLKETTRPQLGSKNGHEDKGEGFSYPHARLIVNWYVPFI